jgi:arsenite methyltransferase
MLAPEEIKACCATAYSGEVARWLLGDSFHPGGARLTARLIRALAVGPEATVVDVASGRGASALQLARETGCRVVGIDLAESNVSAATLAAGSAGLDGQVQFRQGDAEALPVEDGSADGVLCECALCTFPNKPRAAAEIARVLRPDARLALSDVVADPSRLPPALTSLDAWVACIAGARPPEELTTLLADAGLTVERVEREDTSLAALIDRVEARLHLAKLLGANVDSAFELAATARRALAAGALGYAVVIARR